MQGPAATPAPSTIPTLDPDLRDHPSHFVCPISADLFVDPVNASDGFTYERQAIGDWLSRGNNTSPMTGEPLTSEVLYPNRSLRSAVESYRKERGLPDPVPPPAASLSQRVSVAVKRAPKAPLPAAAVSPRMPTLATDLRASSPASLPLLTALYQQARDGDPYAIYQLGYRYMNGKGVQSDRFEALRWYSRLTDQSLRDIARSHPNLDHLELHGCQDLSGSAIVELLRSCRQLRYVGLRGCSGVDMKTVGAIADLARLEGIDLSETPINETCLPALTQLLSRCTTVRLARCREIPPKA